MPNLKTRRGGEETGPAFLSYGRRGPDPAIATAYMQDMGVVETAEARDRYRSVEPGLSVREGMDGRNWDFFRPGQARRRRRADVVAQADEVYRFNGIVKFVVDMMADFVTQGMEIHHPAASKQAVYRSWWRRVDGLALSEQIVNNLYNYGAACVKRGWGQLNAGDVRDLEGASAAADIDVNADVEYLREKAARKNRIPLVYTLLNPATVEVIGGELAMFGQSQSEPTRYGVRIPESILKAIKGPGSPEERAIVANLPDNLLSCVGSGKKLYPLDPDKIEVLHYRKPHWRAWADPLVTSVLKDILLYDRMKDADRAALDGSISRKTLWTLGLPEHQLQPGPGAFKRLREQLLAAGNGGSADIIWDATLKFTETNSEVYKFLGSAKYEPVLQAIYAGLGIPQSLTGGGSPGGMTNNALSLKTLIERLQYARNVLVSFWTGEFRRLQRALGHRQPARLRFDMMSLSDEASEKMIWMQLYDRDLVSAETMQERFGLLADVELSRSRREYKRRDSGDMPHKLGPFAEAAPHPEQLAKAAMQQGTIAPTEAGVKKLPKAKGDRSLLDRQDGLQQQQIDLQKEQMAHDRELAEKQQAIDEKQGGDLHQQKLQQNDEVHQQRLRQADVEHKAMLPVKKKVAVEKAKVQIKQAKAKGQPGQGRQLGQKDSAKRKARTPKPRTTASLWAEAREHQRAIAAAATPLYLAECGRKNVRSLTSAQVEEFERRKFAALLAVPPGTALTSADAAATWSASPAPPPAALAAYDDLLGRAYGDRGVSPTAEDARELQAAAYAAFHDGDGDVEAGADD